MSPRKARVEISLGARLLRLGGLVGVLGLLLAYRGGLLRWGSTPEQRALQGKIELARRVPAYETRDGFSVRVRLERDDVEVRIVTNLLLAEAPSFDEQAMLIYSLRVRALDADGRELWSGVFWERSRKTRVLERDDVVPREDAFLLGAERTPADSRSTHLMVDDLVARGAVALEIAPDQTEGRAVLVRCFRRVKLSREEAVERWKSWSDERKQRVFGSTNIYRDRLASEEERLRLLSEKWTRMPAEGDKGADFLETVDLYVTAFLRERRAESDETPQGAAASPSEHVSVNLVGPCDVSIEVVVDPAADRARPPDEPALLRLTGFTEEGQFIDRTYPIASGDGIPYHLLLLEAPEGVATLTAAPVNFHGLIRFYIDALNLLGGEEISRLVGRSGGEGGWQEIGPERSTVVFWNAFTPPGVRGVPRIEARIEHQRLEDVADLRVSARIPMPGGRPDATATFSFFYELLDDAGEVLATERLAAQARPSLFSRYARHDLAGVVPSESVAFQIRCPKRATRVRLWSEENVSLALYSRLRLSREVVYVPEDYPRSADIKVSRLAFGRPKSKIWFYFRPQNYRELLAARRDDPIEYQRRYLEPRERERDATEFSNFGRFVPPVGVPDRETVFEPLDPEPGKPLVGRGSTYTALAPFADVRVRATDYLEPGNARPLPLELVVGSGGERVLLIVYVDGEKRVERLLRERFTRIDAGLLAQGEHTLRAEAFVPDADGIFARGEPERLVVLAAVPRADGETAGYWNERETYRLTADGPLTVDVHKRTIEPVVLNVSSFFRPDPGSAATRYELEADLLREDRTETGRVRSVLLETRAFNIRRPDPAEGVSFGESGAFFGVSRRFYFGLRSDLRPGKYRVVVRLLGEGEAALRFSLLDRARFHLDRQTWARFNLVGPARLRIAADVPDALARRGVRTLRLVARAQGPAALAPFRDLLLTAPAAGAPAEATIDVPAGTTTYTIGSLADEPLRPRFFLDRYIDALCGLYLIDLPDELRALPWYELVPPETRTGYWRHRPGEAPTSWEIPTDPAEPGARFLKVIARHPFPPGPDWASVRAGWAFDFLAADGTALGNEGTVSFEAFPSDRDFYGDLGVGEERLVPSEPDERFLVAPAGAAAVRLRAVGGPIDLVLLGRVPEVRSIGFSPEDYAEPDGLDLSDLSHAETRWGALAPRDAEARHAAGARPTVVVQREVIRDDPLTAPGAAEAEAVAGGDEASLAETLAPEAYEDRRLLLEPQTDEPPPPERWLPNILAELRPGVPVGIHLVNWLLPGSDEPGAAALHYDLGEGAAGEGGRLPPIEVFVDGQRRLRHDPLQRAGNLHVPGIPPGARELRIDCAAAGARFFVNQRPVPADAAPLFRERAAYGFPADGPMAVTFRKRGGSVVTVNLALYLEPEIDPRALTLRMRLVEDGATYREGVAALDYTTPERLFVLGAPERVTVHDQLRLASRELLRYRAFFPLRDDLADGDHRLQLELLGDTGGREALVRFLVVGPGEARRERAKFRSFREE